MIFVVTMGHSMSYPMEKLLTALMNRILSHWLLRVNWILCGLESGSKS